MFAAAMRQWGTIEFAERRTFQYLDCCSEYSNIVVKSDIRDLTWYLHRTLLFALLTL